MNIVLVRKISSYTTCLLFTARSSSQIKCLAVELTPRGSRRHYNETSEQREARLACVADYSIVHGGQRKLQTPGKHHAM